MVGTQLLETIQAVLECGNSIMIKPVSGEYYDIIIWHETAEKRITEKKYIPYVTGTYINGVARTIKEMNDNIETKKHA